MSADVHSPQRAARPVLRPQPPPPLPRPNWLPFFLVPVGVAPSVVLADRGGSRAGRGRAPPPGLPEPLQRVTLEDLPLNPPRSLLGLLPSLLFLPLGILLLWPLF